ncbi:ABC transporter ATP-binding protein [Amycolatopsis benzoatilytica]|uniref:ABC transporter ATP-binding protein n=1 Tax=Amycolatopsis benzoatilytica TaxID=346045 RepID=UPI00035D4219|nr:ABC transporter ATP-binding protein [Amycolatopsis benzoatilytica]
MTLLSTTGLSKSYSGVPALVDATASFDAGQVTALIGPNGAGKTTFFGTLAGEHAATAGSIVFDGGDITKWDADKRARAGIARTFQVARQFGSFSVLENLLLSFQAGRGEWWRPWRAFLPREVPAPILELAEVTRLDALLGRTAGTLPQGDRKRLELAMALAQDPRVLLLDEPTAGMTDEDCGITVDVLRSVLARRPELCLILTAHDMSVVFALAGRILLMGQGRILLDGAPDEVAAHDLARTTYLGAS